MPDLPMIRTLTRRGAPILVALIALATIGLARPGRAQDGEWPRQFESPSGTFVIYEPQPEDLTGDQLSARAAFSLQSATDPYPIFGVLWFTEHLVIDRDSSMVTGREFDVTRVRLPAITPEQAGRYESLVESEAANWDLSGSLEELRAGLAATERERESIAALDNHPPRIIVSHQRAILLSFDGDPELEAIEGSTLQRVANTPYAVVYDPAARLYYLGGANLWYRARDPLGPWAAIPSPPPAVGAVVPPDTSSADQTEGPPPLVLTATQPTELISTDGPPQYAPLVDGELLYVTNTESDVVRQVSTQSIYVLLSGRWYRAPSFDGPWSFVRADSLPASFKRVPPDSPKGNILASVAGTEQANDAVADAEIPQTSAIRRDLSGFEVHYDGPPQFEPIEGTDMQYAVNSDVDVILADGQYYACDQGVWYIADDPEGPWRVSDTRPLAMDDVPPSSPVYDDRYVYVYDATPDLVYVGYLPGYLGCYDYYGTVVYGTGYHYKPWRHHRYHPRCWTWGLHARYNPWLSRWSFGFSYGSGFLHVGYRWRSWPHGRPRSWYGQGGFRRPLVGRDMAMLRAAHPGRARRRIGDRTPFNLYSRTSNAHRVDRTVGYGAMHPPARLTPRAARVPNDVFAGKDGKVYRRDQGGKWKVNQGRQWKPARIPSTPPSTTARVGKQGNRATEKPLPRPAPVSAPPARGDQSQRVAPPPPNISPTPGDLEREYRARERANPPPSPPQAAPPAPSTPPPSPPPPREGRGRKG